MIARKVYYFFLFFLKKLKSELQKKSDKCPNPLVKNSKKIYVFNLNVFNLCEKHLNLSESSNLFPSWLYSIFLKNEGTHKH